jgi:hypothetical protein
VIPISIFYFFDRSGGLYETNFAACPCGLTKVVDRDLCATWSFSTACVLVALTDVFILLMSLLSVIQTSLA